jgi:hypothetical protein
MIDVGGGNRWRELTQQKEGSCCGLESPRSGPAAPSHQSVRHSRRLDYRDLAPGVLLVLMAGSLASSQTLDQKLNLKLAKKVRERGNSE